MINLFASQASTWRGGRVKPVEPSFFWYCGGGLPSFYFYSFTLLSIMYITSFRLQNKRLILQARVQIANSCNFSMWDTLIIIFFIFLLFLAVAHVAACGLSSTGFHLSTYTGHHRRESGLPLLCPLSPVWPLLVGWEIGRKQRFKKKKTGLHSRRFINPTISRPRKEIASCALWSKIFVGQVQGKGGGQLGNWRTQVVPCFEASTQEEAKEKRLLVETLRLTVDVDEETLETLATCFFFQAELDLVPGFG